MQNAIGFVIIWTAIAAFATTLGCNPTPTPTASAASLPVCDTAHGPQVCGSVLVDHEGPCH